MRCRGCCCHCLHGLDSFTHSVSSSITLISSARAVLFAFLPVKFSFQFISTAQTGGKKTETETSPVPLSALRESVLRTENTATAGDIKQYGMFLISPTVARLITQSVFFFSTAYLSYLPLLFFSLLSTFYYLPQ